MLHGNERRVYGDSAYASQRVLIQAAAPQVKDFTNQRMRKGEETEAVKHAKTRNKPKVRARVEHVFAVIKRLWGFTKARYRGLANIHLARGRPGMSAPEMGARRDRAAAMAAIRILSAWQTGFRTRAASRP